MGFLCYFLSNLSDMRYPVFLLLLLSACNTGKYIQTRHYPATDNFLDTLLQAHAQRLGPVFRYPDSFYVQVIYTRIDRDARNRPRFRDYYYRVDPDRYFYPASTVKLPGAALALEKLNDLAIPGLDRETPMYTDSLPGITPAVLQDSTAANGLPSIAHYIRKIFLVSDNDAFNRLYEFIGQEELNRRLWEMRYTRVQIRHRTGLRLSTEAERHTNALRFERDGKVLYRQPARYSTLAFAPRHDSAGRAYYTPQRVLVQQPMDFSERNRLPLTAVHDLLRSIIFPEAVTKQRRFRLTENDYRFLYRCMSRLPAATGHPAYDSTEFYPAYVKFLLFGGEKNAQVPPGVRIFNKPGWAYGFLTDVAYIADFTHQVEFMVSATVYVNKNGVIGNRYEYSETGKPFLKALGQVLYEYELQRKRKYRPDLSRYK
ncbi:beta-lactamase family protein [Chitinophaga japonensis]|uniref:Beta-lactamase family protein n=2 Tax=Chitinophaga japonensis TaxID=104662 RepID=A0A562T5Z4_CHIJA|nr:beta-lactamase family protein [Chitinophaga japonensis]